MVIYDFLEMFKQTYNGDYYSILFQKWLEKYEGVKLDRGWNEIQNWIEKVDREELRELLKMFQSVG